MTAETINVEVHPVFRKKTRGQVIAAELQEGLSHIQTAMTEAGLASDARAALAAFDRDRLVGLGAHPYLVFMAELRVKMDRAPAAFERF